MSLSTPSNRSKPFVVLALAASSLTAAEADFDQHIFPLLDKHCIECHSADDADGGLNMETFAGLMKGGESGAAVAAGKAEESLLVKFLEGRSGVEGKNRFMPPGKREHLKPDEIAIFKQWILAGAKGPSTVAQKPAMPRKVDTPKILPKGEVKRGIHAAAFSEKSQFIAVGRHGEVELVNPVTRAVVRKLAGFRGKVSALAFSPDGAFIFAAGGEPGIGGDVRKWKVADGSLVKEFAGHTDAAYAVAVSPDGKVIATGGYDQKVKLWNAETGAEIKTLSGHNGAVFGLAFRPDGKVLASTSADRTVKLWAMPAGERLDTFSQPLKEQMAVVFSKDGKHLFAAGADSRIRQWQVSAAAKEGTNPLLISRFAHEGTILQLALSADGTMLASSSSDKTVKVWNPADVTEKRALEKQSDWPNALAFADKTQCVIGRLDGSLAVHDAATGAAVMPPPPPKVEVSFVENRGIQSGASVSIALSGKNLTAATAMRFSNAKIQGEIAPGGKPECLSIKISAEASLPRGAYDMWLVSAGGESERQKLYADELPRIATSSAKLKNAPMPVRLPASIWGALNEVGQQDRFRFTAKAGETLVFDLAVKDLGSKAITPTLVLRDPKGRQLAMNRGLDSGSDPFLAFKVPADGEYEIGVYETTLEGSRDHIYRLNAGALPFVTGWLPLSATKDRETSIELIGHNLKNAKLAFKGGANGQQTLSLGDAAIRSRKPVQIAVMETVQTAEAEPNDEFARAQAVGTPAMVNGRLFSAEAEKPDADLFAFEAKKGQQWVIETLAAMAGSPADTKIEVLDASGKAVPRMLLQAVRDSWINFRSVDAINPDIRLANWEEMDLRQYVFLGGDVIRISRMPRGPDSGCLFFATGGKRRSYFDTSATAHALDEAAYIVEPQPLGADLVPNGLPVFTLNFANDDAGYRKSGADSQIAFTAPADGRYLVRVTDTRSWSGERFVYRLAIREAKPDYTVALDLGGKTDIPRGGSIGFSVRADRKDNFDGPIELSIEGIPAGCFASSPIVIEAGHDLASGSLFAARNADEKADWSKVRIKACAMIGGQKMCKPVKTFAALKLGPQPKFAAYIEPDNGGKAAMHGQDARAPLEITIVPGQTTRAWLRVERRNDEGLINFDVHNLPHGIIVDNIGLNGVQIREKENERDIYLACAKWVSEQDRLIHAAAISARAEQDSAGVQTSFPILLKVRKPAAVTAR